MLGYKELPQHPTELLADDLAAILSPYEDMSVIMRSLLVAELRRCQFEDVEPRTLRGLWYSLVKPSLEKLRLLEPVFYFNIPRRGRKASKPPTAGNLAGLWADKLSTYLAEMVRDGICTYADLNIIDGSRQRRPAQAFDLATDSVKVVGVHYPHIIIFTEKDTIYPILRNLASIYGISAISGGGGPSFACTENLVDDIEDHFNELPVPVSLVLIGLTDYDPSGYTIYDSQLDQLRDVIASRSSFDGIIDKRIGLEPEQLTADELLHNTYHPPEKGLIKWFRRTGGVNGEPLGIELDALPISRIRRMFVDEMTKYIRSERDYIADLRQALIKTLVDESLADRFDEMREKIENGVDEHLLEPSVMIPDIVKLSALVGMPYIEPEGAFDADEVSDLRQALKRAAKQ